MDSAIRITSNSILIDNKIIYFFPILSRSNTKNAEYTPMTPTHIANVAISIDVIDSFAEYVHGFDDYSSFELLFKNPEDIDTKDIEDSDIIVYSNEEIEAYLYAMEVQNGQENNQQNKENPDEG